MLETLAGHSDFGQAWNFTNSKVFNCSNGGTGTEASNVSREAYEEGKVRGKNGGLKVATWTLSVAHAFEYLWPSQSIHRT